MKDIEIFPYFQFVNTFDNYPISFNAKQEEEFHKFARMYFLVESRDLITGDYEYEYINVRICTEKDDFLGFEDIFKMKTNLFPQSLLCPEDLSKLKQQGNQR